MYKEIISAPFSASKKINDDLGNIDTDSSLLAKATFEQADAFYYGAKIMLEATIHKVNVYIKLIDVIAPNLAFSCELFMKAYLNKYNIDYQKLHLLKDLFEKLPNNAQIEIKNNVRIKDYFDLVLLELNDAFVYYRYSHERKCHTTNLKEIFALATAISNYVKNEFKLINDLT